MNITMKTGGRCALALGAGVGLILATCESGTLLRAEWLGLLLFWIPLAVLLAWPTRCAGQPEPESRLSDGHWPLLILAGTLILALFSEWIRHRWFFFLHWTHPAVPDCRPLYPVVHIFVLLTALLTPAMRLKRKWLTVFLAVVLLATLAGSWIQFYEQTHGFDLLTRDDHPSFAFRIWKAFETFPRLRSYNPYWNAGEIHSYGPESGVPGPAIFMAPFLAFLPIDRLYTPMVGMLFIILVPALGALSARLMGLGRTAWIVAALLAFATGHYYYLWLLTYGTIGANLAFAFVMPLTACLYRVVYLGHHDWKVGALLVVSAIFVTLWPPGLLLGIVIGAALLISPSLWTWPKWRFLLICGACFAAIQLRYYLALLNAPLFDFLQVKAPDPSASSGINIVALLAEIGYWIRAHFRQVNPLLLFFGVAGACVIPRPHARRFFVAILIGLALITGAGPSLVPDLQLNRFIMPLLFVAVLPATLAIDELLRLRHDAAAIPRAAVVVLLLLSGWNTIRLWNNEGIQKYRTGGAFYEDFVGLLESEMPAGSRLMFAGHSVHAYGGGHITLFPVLAQREMMASDFYHFNSDHVDYDYPPPPWRNSLDGVDDFIRVYNIALISSIQPDWIERLRAHPDRYEEIAQFNNGQIIVFRPNAFPDRLFHRGSGEVAAHFNRIDVQLDDDADAVIAYHWVDSLRTDNPVELFPYDAGHGVRLIGIRPHGQRSIRIRYP